ncbi:hypothetical protein M885DRAFT_321810 [Pelagophyceae sp. CCMP2097]|nr:hypothetical protein M885DRAFT_321810 [Pelagophyceae sp. CCMP2097]
MVRACTLPKLLLKDRFEARRCSRKPDVQSKTAVKPQVCEGQPRSESSPMIIPEPVPDLRKGARCSRGGRNPAWRWAPFSARVAFPRDSSRATKQAQRSPGECRISNRKGRETTQRPRQAFQIRPRNLPGVALLEGHPEKAPSSARCAWERASSIVPRLRIWAQRGTTRDHPVKRARLGHGIPT